MEAVGYGEVCRQFSSFLCVCGEEGRGKGENVV